MAPKTTLDAAPAGKAAAEGAGETSARGDDAAAILRRHGDAVVAYFGEMLDRYAPAPARLVEAIRYSLLAGGKKLRPALVLECASACAGEGGRGHNRSALAAAAAIELIHTFSLVHDDLPAMDNDDLRRGRPTNHKVYGEAMAILAGDAMTTMAFEIIATDADAALAPTLISELAHASGPMGMIGGQVLDMDGENKSLSLKELQKLHRLKTGALLIAACRLGAVSAGAAPAIVSAVSSFGEHLGLAFQIVDDLLDVTATPAQLGKATNKDQAKGKNTYPTLLGVAESRREAASHLQSALDAIAPLGAKGRGLAVLARFVVEREM